ncbi:SGNH/GDSL hydrolase family protein [Arthrobacter sp. 35W]|uniref:SGNH/GDSL hydrolase family protein n=1 Tax=Arthrobacter sp. 35W TaxID=1132441 RepID=UPI0003FA4D8A|nr:SGNH/GDSL hydrolase family protein [Arthrobacter sp. 35W]
MLLPEHENKVLAEGGLLRTRNVDGPPWRRYVAVGDSFTAGFGDPDPRSPKEFRGWAGWVAGELSRSSTDFAYANLAVPGLRLRQVASEQVPAAVALAPDLVTFQAGGNDLILPGADPDQLATLVDAALASLTATGATVAIFVGPDSGSGTVLGRVRAKIAVYNENVRSAAAHHNAVVVDLWSLERLKDRQMWGPDRLHLSPPGHLAVAALVLDTLGVPHGLEPADEVEAPDPSWREARIQDLAWTRDYFIPWLLRGLARQPTRWKPLAQPPVQRRDPLHHDRPRKAA